MFINGIIKIDLRASPTRQAPDRNDLKDLLALLGYSVEQFQAINIDSKPIDERPEGALASLIADQFGSWFPSNQGAQEIKMMDQAVGDRVKVEGPSFLQTVRKMIDGTLGREAFGELFDFDEFIDVWRDNFVSQYQNQSTG
mgnify:CR=1 FL=1